MIRRLRRRRGIFRGLPLAFAALALVPAASAGTVHFHAIDTTAFPSVRASLVAPVGAATPRLTENGHPAAGYSAINLGREKAIVLALDRSQSMRGRPLAAAVAAARAFVGAVGARDHVSIVGFGRDAFALTRSSTPSEAHAALDSFGVDPHAGTALYDAIVLSADRLRNDERPGRAIIVVTDGQDVSSIHTLQDAIEAAHAARASVYTIGIAGPGFTPDILEQIAASTGGSYRQATRATGLGTVYTGLVHELARTWQLTYMTPLRPGAKVRLTATVPGAGTARRALTLAGASEAAQAPTGLIPGVGYSAGGTLLVGLAVGFLILLACGFWYAAQRGGALRARIEPHLGTVERSAKNRRVRGRKAARAQIANSFERAFGGLGLFKRLQVMIDRADLPLRAGELAALSAGTGFLLGLFVAVTVAQPIAILLAMAIGALIPIGFVSYKASDRLKRFENQLPDILITIAASLKAGHSFRQGIQSVVDEGADPAAREFRRVLTETQLGKPMDEALSDLAGRVGSKNLSFVINAVTIQRQIGGSLAGLFDMVAETVRQRQQFRRKVKGLTAQGRMSAYTLIALPFFVAAVVSVMNPTFMSPLYHTSTGHLMLITGLVMITIGSALLQKIVSFKG